MEWERKLSAVSSHIDLGFFEQTLPATQLTRMFVKDRAVWPVRSRGPPSDRDRRLKEDPSRLRRLPLLFPQQAYLLTPTRVQTLTQTPVSLMATMNMNRSASHGGLATGTNGSAPTCLP